MKEILVEMKFHRETPNKVRFQAVDDTKGINEVYISKVALGARPFPTDVTVLVTIK